MNHSRLRFLTALLALSSAGMLLASCGSANRPDDGSISSADTEAADSAAEETVSAEPDALDARKQIDDELGDFDFEGRPFRVYISEYTEDAWIADAETGDVINDAAFQRNTAVEERFHCDIVPTQLWSYDLHPFMHKSILANEDLMDLVSSHAVGTGKLTLSDLFMNWYDIPHINFEKPWWSPSTIDDLTYKGVCLSAIGDAGLTAMSAAYCVFYNKNLGASYDIPDMYEVVNDGKWTWDYLLSLTKDLYVDQNGNGEADNDDLFGYTSDRYSNMNAYLWAFDNPVFKKDGDNLTFSYKTPKVNDIVTALVSAFKDNPGIRCDFNYQNTLDGSPMFYSRDMFAEGKSVFANGQISQSLTHFRDLEDDYGILPYPKWDENQTAYHTMADGFHEIMSVPLTVQDTEFVGVITEALNAEAYKTIVPAYYDVALKVKGARDPESVAMLDMIVNSRVFDFGYIYDCWNGCSFLFEQIVSEQNPNFESFYAKREKRINRHYEKVTEFFENYSH